MLFSVPATVVAIIVTSLFLYLSIRRLIKSTSPYVRDQTLETETSSHHLLISLGSGGHTTEMFYILEPMDLSRFTKRTYYITSGDTLSRNKAESFEKRKAYKGQYRIKSLARARRVKQSWATTPMTAVISFVDSLRHTWLDSPDLLICNGPGTCVMLVIACLVIRVRSGFIYLQYALMIGIVHTTKEQPNYIYRKLRACTKSEPEREDPFTLGGQILGHVARTGKEVRKGRVCWNANMNVQQMPLTIPY